MLKLSRPKRATWRAGTVTCTLLAALVGGGLPPGPAGAATVTNAFSADADAHVAQADPSTNDGRSATLSVDGDPVLESYVRFNVTGLDEPVTRATLRLYATDGSKHGLSVYPAGSSWSESSINWSNRPARTGGAVADLGSVSKRRYVEIDVTPVVTGNALLTFNLAGSGADSTQFSSREAKNRRPELVVETGGASEPPPPPPSSEGSLAFAAAADAKVAEASPSTNYGKATTLEADNSPVLESYLRFPVSGVDGLVTRAVVRLYVTNASKNGPAIYPSASGWSEDEITWSNRPLRTGAAADDKDAISAGGYVEFDVTGIVAGNGEYNFNIAPTSSDGSDFSSREASGNRPELVIAFSTSSSDTTPPETTITSGPSGTVASGEATFEFASSEGGSVFQCRIDALTFAGCTSPTTYSGLVDGSHTFEVRAIDGAGNIDPTPAARTWTSERPDVRSALLAPESGAHFGVHYQIPRSLPAADQQQEILDFEAALGRTMGIDHWYEPWGNTFPDWREDFALDAGRIPMISWGRVTSTEVTSGTHDSYIRARADGIKSLGEPVFIRWAWEMDGTRNADITVSPSAFIAAWRHIHDIFEARGATNVAWVWCPNATAFRDGDGPWYYPGDDYVDWVCADGYNFYPDAGRSYETFESKFTPFNDWAVRQGKPAMAGEWGSQEMGPGERAEWVDDAREAVKTRLTGILAMVYFHSLTSEHDWRLLPEPDAFEAFRQMGFDPYFNPF